MKMTNQAGQAIYFNPVEKHGKLKYVVLSADGQPIIGRDKQKRQSRTFAQEHQAAAYLKRNGYRAER